MKASDFVFFIDLHDQEMAIFHFKHKDDTIMSSTNCNAEINALLPSSFKNVVKNGDVVWNYENNNSKDVKILREFGFHELEDLGFVWSCGWSDMFNIW